MKITKSAALKASLFMVLAANISWERVEFGTAELAATGVTSETVKGAPSTAAPVTTGDGVVSVAPDSMTVKVNAPAPAPVVLGKPKEEKAAIAKTTTHASGVTERVIPVKKFEAPKHSAEFKICEEPYKVTYTQIEADGDTQTVISAMRASSSKREVTMTVDTGLIQTIDRKDSANRQLTAAVRAYRLEKGEPCGSEKPATETASKETVVETKETAKEAAAKLAAEKEEEKKQLADGIKNCTLDKDGGTIERSAKADCLIGQLYKIEKRIDIRDAKGKRISEEAMSKLVTLEVQKIHKELKGLLRTELVPTRKSRRGESSIDNSRAEEAQDLAERAMDALEDVGDRYDIGRSSRSGKTSNTVSKMIGEISALRNASIEHTHALELEEDAKEIRDDMRSKYAEAWHNPSQQAFDEYSQAARDHAQFAQQVRQDEKHMSMFRNSSLISSQDYKAFSAPYENIRRYLSEAISRNTTGNDRFGDRFSGRDGDRFDRGSDRFSDRSDGRSQYDSLQGLAAIRSRTTPVGAFPQTAPALSLPPLPAMPSRGY